MPKAKQRFLIFYSCFSKNLHFMRNKRTGKHIKLQLFNYNQPNLVRCVCNNLYNKNQLENLNFWGGSLCLCSPTQSTGASISFPDSNPSALRMILLLEISFKCLSHLVTASFMVFFQDHRCQVSKNQAEFHQRFQLLLSDVNWRNWYTIQIFAYVLRSISCRVWDEKNIWHLALNFYIFNHSLVTIPEKEFGIFLL